MAAGNLLHPNVTGTLPATDAVVLHLEARPAERAAGRGASRRHLQQSDHDPSASVQSSLPGGESTSESAVCTRYSFYVPFAKRHVCVGIE